MPTADSAIITATPASATKAMLRKIGKRVRNRASRAAASPVELRCPLRGCEAAIDEHLQDLPDKVRDEQDHDGAEGSTHEPVEQSVAAGELGQVNLPETGEEQGCGKDQKRAQPPLHVDRCKPGRAFRIDIVVPRFEEMGG